jgi:hypothetical protein
LSIEYPPMETLVAHLETPPVNPYQSPLSPPTLQWKLKWYAPTWNNLRQYRLALRRLYRSGYGFGLAGVVLVTSVAIGIIAKIAVPPLGFDFVWRALLVDTALLTILPLIPFFACHLPVRVSIREDGAIRCADLLIRPADLQSLQIVVLSTNHAQLVVRERGRLHKIAVSPRTDISQLTSLLGLAESVDMQRHFRLARQWMGVLRKPRKALMQNNLIESDAV